MLNFPQTLRAALALAALTSTALAQTAAPTNDRNPPATAAQPSLAPADRAGSVTEGRATESGAPEPGANSFTEGQARSRLEGAGFTGVEGLTKDEQGVWRGRATRNGQPAEIALDFRGNVTPR